jgi:L-alanine-DL-glutamate epimerase-like enolase superfamily enzyme
MKITAVDSLIIDVPQVPPVAPYRSRYVATSHTGALLIRIETDRGLVGWGEAPQRLPIPIPHYDGGKTFSGLEAEGLRERMIGEDATALEKLYCDWELDGGYVQSAVEMAMWDLLGQLCGQPLYQLLGGLYRDEIELAACMGIRPPHEAGEIARQYLEAGFTTMKIKAGRDPEEDLAMVRAIREAVGDRLALRVDPNTGYEPDVCLDLAKQLESYGLQYFEQPMAKEAIEDSARIRRLTTTPLALNESVTTLANVRRILELDAAAVLLPDTYQCGGIRVVRQIADLAATAEVPCVFHCAHDFGLKTAAMLHVCAATANFSLASDCTYYGLAEDILVEPHRIEAGRMAVPRRPGLGVQVDLARLRRYLVAGTWAL